MLSVSCFCICGLIGYLFNFLCKSRRTINVNMAVCNVCQNSFKRRHHNEYAQRVLPSKHEQQASQRRGDSCSCIEDIICLSGKFTGFIFLCFIGHIGHRPYRPQPYRPQQDDIGHSKKLYRPHRKSISATTISAETISATKISATKYTI